MNVPPDPENIDVSEFVPSVPVPAVGMRYPCVYSPVFEDDNLIFLQL